MAEINFKGIWLPKEILYEHELNSNEKIILGIICGICKASNKCFISNKFVSELVGVTTNRASKIISSLREKGYIKSMISYKENSKEIENRVITPIGEKIHGYCSKEQEGIFQKANQPIGENDKDIINNNYNNKYNIQNKNKFIPYHSKMHEDIDWNKFYIN